MKIWKLIRYFTLLPALAFVWLAWPTHTPAFTDPDGLAVEGSIAEEEWLSVNGLQQWTLSRGRDRKAPLLLVLHGGPGIAEFAWFRASNSDLEDSFVVVHWDQRGAGKSFDGSTPPETMNLEQFLSDMDKVVDHLRSKFGRQRIALLGHSWGTVLGTIYTSRHPEKISGYIGTGQIADLKANEERSYAFALGEARRLENEEAIADLVAIGPPPYGVENMMVQRAWLEAFGGGSTHQPRSLPSRAWIALSVPEFNFFDLVSLVRGALFSLEFMWDEVLEINLDRTYLQFDVPVFFILGRHDHQTPSELAEPYFHKLTAPDKELFYFEHSAHSPALEEPERFSNVLATIIKPRLLPDRIP